MKSKFINVFMLSTAALMTACSSTDVYDANAIENKTKAEFAESFIKEYPNVNLNQSWDYSTKQSYYTFGGILGNSKKIATRAVEGNIVKTDNWYEVDNATLDWMQNTLKEKINNSSLGKAFIMTAPNSDFTLVPIHQGIASAIWNLHVVIDGTDYKIWEKSEDIEVKDDGNVNKGKWYPIKGVKTYEWWTDGAWWSALENTIGGDRFDEFFTTVNENGDIVGDGEKNETRTKVKVTATRAKEIRFSGLPVGAEMYFYLEVTTSGNYDGFKFQDEGAHLTSIDHHMLALDVPRPANIPADDKAMIIGCEDANLENSDWDYNDVVFLVYGKDIPKPREVTEGTTIKEATTVRYMIEDLGATDDFDFNDIVLDVSDIIEKTPVYTNDKLTEWKEGRKYQEAVIRHLGGTLPFTLTIGDTELKEHPGMMNVDPNERYEVSGWDMNNHNISVKVRQKGGDAQNEGVNTIRFPKAGEAPMIITVDPSQGWMSERTSVPEDWFTVPEEE